MTSDLETMRLMLDRAGIVFKENTCDYIDGAALAITITARRGEKNHGYWEFISDLYFNADGALIGSGGWE